MKKNVYEQPPITPETTYENARKWLSIMRYRESGTVIQIQDDCEYRVPEILRNKELLKKYLGPYYKKYLLAYVPIDQNDLHATIIHTIIKLCDQNRIQLPKHTSNLDLPTLLEIISQKGFEVGLFISHVSHLLTKKTMQPFIDLETAVRLSKNLSMIVFTHIDITNKTYMHLTDSCSFLFDHVIRYPLYGKTDTLQFCNWATHQWEAILPHQVISDIIDHCGGYLWVTHHALRAYRNNPELGVGHAISTNTILTIVESIWNRFSEAEKEIIRNIHLGTLRRQDTIAHEYEHLTSLHVVGNTGKVSILRMPILGLIIERESCSQTIKTKKEHIIIGKKDITEIFSRKEIVFLTTLISSKKKIVPRDALAKLLWGNMWEEKYSDWSIDRLAYQVRKKLHNIGIDTTLLQSIKKKGFMFG